MKRTQIYLADDEYEALRKHASKQRMSISSVLRTLIKASVLRKPPVKSKKRYAAGLLELAGLIHETKSDVAERHDEYLWGEAK